MIDCSAGDVGERLLADLQPVRDRRGDGLVVGERQRRLGLRDALRGLAAVPNDPLSFV
jgi:nucleotidyltransferase/DNA polymerase involved in DNA repair